MSKLFCRWAILSLGLVSTAHAAVLLEKVATPGFVMPGYAISKTCTIQEDGKLSIEYQLNGMSSKRVISLQLSKSSINSQIAEAAKGNVTSETYPVDVPSVAYRAYQKTGSKSKAIVLYEQNGGTGQQQFNDSASVVALRNFIDVNCGDELMY